MKENSFLGADSDLFAYYVLFKAGLEELEPNDFLAYSNLLVKKNDREGAIPILNGWIQRQPTETLPYQQAAENLLALNKKNDLESLVDKMETNIPDSDLALIYRGNLAMMAGNQGLALEWFEKALRKNPDNTELYDFLYSQNVELKMPEKTAELNALVENAKSQNE
jgi:tetratricopeptide (TPR) repeat protein